MNSLGVGLDFADRFSLTVCVGVKLFISTKQRYGIVMKSAIGKVENFSHSIAEQLKVVRAAVSKGEISKAELCRRSGVSYRQVMNILDGSNQPYAKTMAKLVDALALPSEPLNMVRDSRVIYGMPGLAEPADGEPMADMKSAIEAIAKQTGLSKAEVLNSVCDAMKKKVLGRVKGGVMYARDLFRSVWLQRRL